jgi:hypothetical protein
MLADGKSGKLSARGIYFIQYTCNQRSPSWDSGQDRTFSCCPKGLCIGQFSININLIHTCGQTLNRIRFHLVLLKNFGLLFGRVETGAGTAEAA